MTGAAPATPVPAALQHPAGVWFFDWVIPIAGGAVIVWAVADSVRRRQLTWWLLFLLNSMLVYWMETMGDWGQELLYSPAFARHHLLDWLPVKTPNDPLFMPFAYAVYWTVHALVVLGLGQLLMSRFGISMLRAILILAVPVNYAWDFLVEGIATAAGWWTYDPGMGPSVTWSDGGRITLLWTVGLMCVWPNLIAYWAGKPPVRGLNHLERFLGLRRWTRPAATRSMVPDQAAGDGGVRTLTRTVASQDALLDYDVVVPRWRFEVARFAAWFVVFQLSFFLLLIVPLVLMRVLTGHDSVYVP